MSALVNSGCAVTATSPASMSVSVASGSATLNGSPVTVGSATVALIGSSGPSHYEIVASDSSGTASSLSMDSYAASPTSYVPLGLVYVETGVTSVTDPDITDRRPVPQAPPLFLLTSDPHVVGRLWNNAGVVNVSAG